MYLVYAYSTHKQFHYILHQPDTSEFACAMLMIIKVLVSLEKFCLWTTTLYSALLFRSKNCKAIRQCIHNHFIFCEGVFGDVSLSTVVTTTV